ncbi:MAG TPA: family 16 glycoside hydrolase, partial [Bryobacteraceae bacterium]|nr:family 16 glycoside hydrolase [Bryobacteraceae bacterium]
MLHRHSFQITILVVTGWLVSALANGQEENTLTPQEKADGWQLLFDGKNLNGWHSYLEKGAGKDWSVEDNAIRLKKNNGDPESDY